MPHMLLRNPSPPPPSSDLQQSLSLYLYLKIFCLCSIRGSYWARKTLFKLVLSHLWSVNHLKLSAPVLWFSIMCDAGSFRKIAMDQKRKSNWEKDLSQTTHISQWTKEWTDKRCCTLFKKKKLATSFDAYVSQTAISRHNQQEHCSSQV